jgi:hypothetical protein
MKEVDYAFLMGKFFNLSFEFLRSRNLRYKLRAYEQLVSLERTIRHSPDLSDRLIVSSFISSARLKLDGSLNRLPPIRVSISPPR